MNTNRAPGEILQLLVGLPLWDIGRASTLQWFAFGNERRVVPTRNGGSKIVSEYSLHTECAWHIRHGDRILVASSDRYYPAGEDPYADIESFEWDSPGANQLDERISKLLEPQKAQWIVQEVHAELSGSFVLSMTENMFLNVFPDNSIIDEYWRLFRPYSSEDHFVFTRDGITVE